MKVNIKSRNFFILAGCTKGRSVFMYDSQTIYTRIKARARERKVLIRDMLAACDLSINAISQISDKKGLSSFSLARIADYLDCSVDYLLGRTDNPEVNR